MYNLFYLTVIALICTVPICGQNTRITRTDVYLASQIEAEVQAMFANCNIRNF